VFRALRERTPPFLEGRHNDLTRPDVLEREWISAYSAQQPAAWPEERFTSGVWTIPEGLLNIPLPEGALFSSEVAAAQLGASIRPASVLIHVDGDDRTRKELIRHGRLRRDETGMIRLRPALWRIPPIPTEGQTVPPLLIRADLLLEAEGPADDLAAECRRNGRCWAAQVASMFRCLEPSAEVWRRSAGQRRADSALSARLPDSSFATPASGAGPPGPRRTST